MNSATKGIALFEANKVPKLHTTPHAISGAIYQGQDRNMTHICKHVDQIQPRRLGPSLSFSYRLRYKAIELINQSILLPTLGTHPWHPS